LKRWYRYTQEGKSFLYVDESGFAPTTQRDYAWAECGRKIYGYRSGERRPRTSLIAALSEKQLIAPMLFSGTCNTITFNSWLEQELLPYLNNNVVVVVDNAAFHKSKETERIITKTGAILLFLPPYSPHLMPIEQTFGTIKKIRKYNEALPLDQIIKAYQ
jgi:transposase